MIDEIDKQILKSVKKRSGAQAKTILEEFRELRSKPNLYARLTTLHIQGYILKDGESQKGKVFCHITPLGRETLGREENPTQTAGSP
jgi:DNA-binding PadR family transcriptional regulator